MSGKFSCFILLCLCSTCLAFPSNNILGTSSNVWDMIRNVFWSQKEDKPSHKTGIGRIELRQSLYQATEIIACGDVFCKKGEKCSHNTTQCHSLLQRYGPPCCIGEHSMMRHPEEVKLEVSRDFVQPQRRPAPTVMGHGGYGVPVFKKSIFELCIEQIIAAGGKSFNYEKMHATLRIIQKLAEAKFLGNVEDKEKRVDFMRPVFDIDLDSLKGVVDTISPCSGFLYQSDILLQEDQMDLVIENAISYVGDPIRNLKLKEIFSDDELELLERSPMLKQLQSDPAPCPPYNPCKQSALPPAPPPSEFINQWEDEQTKESPRTIGELIEVFARHRLRQKRKIASDPSTKWKVPIRYKVDAAVNGGVVEEGVRKWSENTCITFKKTTLPIRKLRGNFLHFVKGEGCHSMVGKNKNGEGQAVSLGPGCENAGTVSHEIGHALGLWHEHARPDRDSSVNIVGENIPKKYLGQFMVQDFRTKGIPYDYGSIMHYAAKSYVKSAKLFSIKAEIYKNTMGQRKELAFLDIKVVNQRYCKDVCPSNPGCKNGGYADPKSCSVCKCPNGLAGKCDKPAPSSGGCGKGELIAIGTWQELKISGSKTCNFLIKAPSKITIEIKKSDFKCAKVCSSYVEVKYLRRMAPTGARYCCNRGTQTLTTEGKKAVIIYKGQSGHTLHLRYKG